MIYVVAAVALWVVLLQLLTLKRLKDMTTKFDQEKAALLATLATITSENASILAYVSGVPNLIAAAVADGLVKHDIGLDDAADTIEAARAKAAESVNEVITAIQANTAPPGADTGGGATMDDSVNAGGGDDSLTGGAADTPAGGTGDDSLGGGQGNDSV